MNDLKNVYTDFAKDVKETVRALPVLLLSGVLYFLILYLFNRLTFRLSTSGLFYLMSVFRWALKMLFLAHFATLMTHAFTHHKLELRDILRFDTDYVFQLTEALFWVYLVNWFLSRFTVRLGMGSILLLLWQVFTAPSYEAAYIGHEKSGRIFPALVDFWKVNGVPAAVYGLIALIVYEVILPRLSFAVGGSFIIAEAITGIWYGLYLYTKAILFRILYFSNPRSRAFHNSIER